MITFPHIRIVLVDTSHPGNIGATARAMKNMGLSQLYLVNPRQFPHPEAEWRSSNAEDILQRAKVCISLQEAIAGCYLVFGTSARRRIMSHPVVTPRQAAKKICTAKNQPTTALVFGRESSGLTNAELEQCNYHLQIPANPEYSSLNLAAAVQVCCYELRMAMVDRQTTSSITEKNSATNNLPTIDELAKLYQHIEQTMIKINFLKPDNPRRLMQRMRRIINRATIDKNDLDLLHGMMSAIDKIATRGKKI